MTREKTEKEIPGAGLVLRVANSEKKRKLRVTFFPQGGGQPYEIDVEPDNEGLFTINEALTFKVARGSVWQGRDGILRTTAHEGNPFTINAQVLDGNGDMHPRVLHGVAMNNLVAQYDQMQRQRGVWRQAGTYGLILIGVGLLLVGVWMVQAVGGGLETLAEAIKDMQAPAGSAGGSPGSSGGASPSPSHQPIAPGQGGR